jgi:hypothetical protein
LQKVFPEAGKRPKLEIRKEAGLFTNRIDHSVVYDAISGSPILIVEVKKPADQVAETVAGQLMDYLLAMRAFGHPNPFAVLTTFEKTDLGWVVG